MRVGGLQLRDSGDVVAWWMGAGQYRAVVQLRAGERADLIDRLLERLPGAAHHEVSLRSSLGALTQPGRAVAVQATGFEHWIGLVRPFALGELGSVTPVLTAVVRRDVLSVPLLTCDAAAAAAYEEAFDGRAGARQAWQRFVVEDGLGELAGSARGGSRAPQTALERGLIDAIESERVERGRMLSIATGASRVRLTH